MKYYSPSTQEILTASEILARHSNTSFAATLPEADLAGFGYFPIHEDAASKPLPDYTKNYFLSKPEFIDGRYFERWGATPASQEEISARTEECRQSVRAARNALLTDCDWTQLPDAPVDAVPWATYRQALRDITTQAGFPWDVTWPEVPAA